MRFRVFSILALAAFITQVRAEESYLGMFLQGQRIGYMMTSQEDSNLGSIKAKLTRSVTVMDTAMLGSSLKTTIDQSNWANNSGEPLLLKFSMESAGRTQRVEANFSATNVRVAIDNNGSLTRKVLPLPKDAPIVDDALTALLSGDVGPGAKRTFYVFDPMTATFVKNTATLKGTEKLSIDGVETQAQVVVIAEPRMSMTTYLSAKGDFLQATALGGLLLKPMSKQAALEPISGGASVDLAEATRIPVKGMGESPAKYKSVTYRFSGTDLARLPQDGAQSVKKSGDDWIVTVTPIVPVERNEFKTVESLAKGQPNWIQPGLHVSSSNSEIAKFAKEAVGKATAPLSRVKRIAQAVHNVMVPNAGIGVLRDSIEILKTKEGVCRDYAILTAALIRSQKIPARLASGLVYDSNAFYYHAWVEVWDGKQWYGVDSTRQDGRVTAGHIKLAQGSVEDAFLFTFLDRSSVQVVRAVP